jgi:hypothetical protein
MNNCKDCKFWDLFSWGCSNSKVGKHNPEDHRDDATDDFIAPLNINKRVELFPGPNFGCVHWISK